MERQLPPHPLRIAVKLSGEKGWAVKDAINELGSDFMSILRVGERG